MLDVARNPALVGVDYQDRKCVVSASDTERIGGERPAAKDGIDAALQEMMAIRRLGCLPATQQSIGPLAK